MEFGSLSAPGPSLPSMIAAWIPAPASARAVAGVMGWSVCANVVGTTENCSCIRSRCIRTSSENSLMSEN